MGALIVHDQFVSLATRLIKKNGRKVNLITFTSNDDEWDAQNQKETLTEVIAVQTEYDLKEVDGDLVLHTDKKFLVDSLVPITEDMKLRDDDGVTYSIGLIDHLRVGETSILYTLRARK